MKILAITLTALLGFYPFSTSHAQNSDPIKPNVIIIFTDDQGYGDLASYGNAELNTPHTDRMAEEGRVQLLYDLEADIGETTDVSEQNPDVVNRLEELAEKARVDLGDDVTGQEGNNLRPVGTLK